MLNFQLGVAASAGTVQVTAASVSLEQDSAETGGVIDSLQVSQGTAINGP